MSALWTPEARALLHKELLQARRSRTVILTAAFLPTLLMLVVPLAQLAAFRSAGRGAGAGFPPGAVLPPGIADLGSPLQLFLRFNLPLFVCLVGMLMPSLLAVYTVIVERERRTVELLVALPLSLLDVLLAKLAAIMVLVLGVTLPLFVVDAVFLLALGVAEPAYVGLLLLVLVGALVCSVGLALLLALLARDYRTAQQVNGALVLPLLLLTLGILAGVPGELRLPVLAGVLTLIGLGCIAAGLRWVTFDRYLS